VGVKKLVVEMDARYIKGMLNAPDLQPNAAMNRWIFAILLYTFELVHVPAVDHKAADGLSRRPMAEDDTEDEEDEEWIDRALEVTLFSQSCLSAQSESPPQSLVWEKNLEDIQAYLRDLREPEGLTKEQRQAFVKHVLKFFVHEGKMWLRGQHGCHKRVPAIGERKALMKAAHDGLGHKGIYGTHQTLKDRFWWPSMHKDVAEYVKTCHECQLRSTKKPFVPLVVQHPLGLFRKVHVDAMLMPKAQGYRYILAARCDLSGYIEGKMTAKSNSKSWKQFLWEQLLCRWGAIELIVSDNGSEVKSALAALAARYPYAVQHVTISPYNSRANGVVERGHFPIREALLKMCKGNTSLWPEYFHYVLWADRITTRRATGYSPYFMAHGLEPTLPLDLVEASFMLPFTEPVGTEELIAQRALQLMRREKDVQQVADLLVKKRLARKLVYDKAHAHCVQPQDFEAGDLVLVRNSAIEMEVSKKFKPRWFGPMVVVRKSTGGGYVLAELDGSVSKLRYAAARLLPYFARAKLSVRLVELTTGAG
jgi:hypothetical protein